MLVPVHDKHGLPVGGFDQILQRIQLFIMDNPHIVKLVVAGAVGKLEELVGEDGCVERQDIPIRIGQKHIPFHLLVQFHLPGGERDLHDVFHLLGHIQMIGGLHGYADIGQFFVDGFLGPFLQLMPVGEPAVGGSEIQVDVGAERSAQPCPFIQ